MNKFRKAFAAGRNAYMNRSLGELFTLSDPVGEESQADQLRALGKWRFIFVRGFLGYSVPLCLLSAVFRIPQVAAAAHRFHGSWFQLLLPEVIAGIGVSALFGFVVGLLAWRRLNSEFWPGEANSESSVIMLGPIGPRS